MVHTYSDSNKIYLVDMMIAYVNIFGYPTCKIDTNDYFRALKMRCWRKHGDKFSPIDVLNEPDLYAYDMNKITNANLHYPIIIHNGNIVDGMHRLTKAYLNRKSHLKAYMFDDELMKKFLIDKKGNYNKLEKMQIYDFIEMFNRKFTK